MLEPDVKDPDLEERGWRKRGAVWRRCMRLARMVVLHGLLRMIEDC